MRGDFLHPLRCLEAWMNTSSAHNSSIPLLPAKLTGLIFEMPHDIQAIAPDRLVGLGDLSSHPSCMIFRRLWVWGQSAGTTPLIRATASPEGSTRTTAHTARQQAATGCVVQEPSVNKSPSPRIATWLSPASRVRQAPSPRLRVCTITWRSQDGPYHDSAGCSKMARPYSTDAGPAAIARSRCCGVVTRSGSVCEAGHSHHRWKSVSGAARHKAQ